MKYSEYAIEKDCIVCGEKFELSFLLVCDTCRKIEKERMQQAREFLEENPKATISEISEKTGIPEKTVNWHYINKKLSGKLNTANYQSKGIIINDTIYGNYACLEINGKLDSSNAFELQRYIDRLMACGWTHIILDMRSVTFFSSTAIRVVLSTYKKLNKTGYFRITNPSKNVKNVIGMVALDSLLLK